ARVAVVVARLQADLEALRAAPPTGRERVGSLGPDRAGVVALVESVATRVEQRAGEVLADARVAQHAVDLQLEAAAGAQPAQPPVQQVARGRAALLRVVQAEELALLVARARQLTAAERVVADHPGAVVGQGVTGREHGPVEWPGVVGVARE